MKREIDELRAEIRRLLVKLEAQADDLVTLQFRMTRTLEVLSYYAAAGTFIPYDKTRNAIEGYGELASKTILGEL